MANTANTTSATPEKIQVVQYRISGFNVVVTMPDGQQKVLKDGLADLMLGNIVLVDKDGNLISTDSIISNINLKQNALDSAFLGDFIRSKDEHDLGADKEKAQQSDALPDQANTLAKQAELESTIEKLHAQIEKITASNPQADEIARLTSQNQLSEQQLNSYLHQLQQAKTEVAVLKQAMEDNAEAIKQQLPQQNLAEVFQANHQDQTEDSSSTNSNTPAPAPRPLISASSSSSSSSSPSPEVRVADNQVVVDRDTLQKLEEEKNQAQADKDKAEAEKADAQAQADQAIADKTQIQADKDKAEADKAQAEAEKAQAEADKDKVESILTDLGKAHFISPDLKITAKLNPDSDHGNDIDSTHKDNITNDKTPTIIGTATEGKAEDNINNTVTLLIYRDDNASTAAVTSRETRAASDPAASESATAASSGTQVVAATITIPAGGNWTYTIPDTTALIDGKYRFIAITNSDINGTTKSSNPWIGDFTIDTAAPPAALRSVTTAVVPDETDHPNDWVTATAKPAFTGDTKPGSEVVLTLTPTDPDSTETVHTYKATANTIGVWAIYVDADETEAELTGSNYNYSINVTDNAGNTGSATGKLVVDTSDLKSTLELTQESDTGDSHKDWATKENMPTFTGTTTKNGKPAAHVHVKITVDGETYTGDSNELGVWTITASKAIANGTQIALLHAKDDLGKEFTDSHLIFIDNTAPNINASLTYDTDTGQSHTDGITNSITPTLQGITKAVPMIVTPDSSSATPAGSDTSAVAPGTAVPAAAVPGAAAPGTAASSPAATPALDIVPTTTTPGAHIKLTIYYNPTGQGYFDSANPGLSKVDSNSFKITKEFTANANGSWSFPVPISEILSELKNNATYNTDNKNQFVAHPTHATDGIYQYSVDITDTMGNRAVTDPAHLLQWTIDTTAPKIQVAGTLAERTDSTDPVLSKDPYATKVPSPTYTITTEPGSHVVVTYPGASGTDSEPAFTATANENGIATITLAKPLPIFVPGSDAQPTMVHFAVTDKAGNTSEQDIGMKYIPSDDLRVPISASLTHDTRNDTGVSQTDSITNNSRPEISGTSQAGAMVHLKISTGGRTYDTPEVKVGADGNWKIQLTADLAEGITTFQAIAKKDGFEGSTLGSLTVDKTAPVLDNFGLGGPALGNAVSQPPDERGNFPVVFEKTVDPADSRHIIFSTSQDLRQQSMASFTGTASESVANVLINTLDGVKGPNQTGWKNLAEIHSATHNGRPIVAWAGGFNYYHGNLTNAARDKLKNADPFAVLNGNTNSLPISWNNGDLNWVQSAIFGLGWRGFSGTWTYDRNWITVTDLAGNSTQYHITVRWNANAPQISSINVDTKNITPYNTDHPEAVMTGYSNSTNGFNVTGQASGAEKVYLVDVSKYSADQLASQSFRQHAVWDALAHKAGTSIVPGTINATGQWSIPYLASFRDGEAHDIKVIPVLVNDAGRVQNNINYINVFSLKQDYAVTAGIDKKDSLDGHTTDNTKPLFTGDIDHYDSAAGITGVINIAGKAYPIEIKESETVPGTFIWTFTPSVSLSSGSNNYSVTITDKYGNTAKTDRAVDIGGSLAARIDAADDSGVSDSDGITNNQSPHFIGKIAAGDTVKVTYKLQGATTDTTISSVETKADGNWVATLPSGTTLADGTYSFTVTSFSSTGTQTASTTKAFTIDTSAPTSVTTGIDTSKISTHALNPSGSLFNATPVLTGKVTTGDDTPDATPNSGLPVTVTIQVPNGDSTFTSYVYTTNTKADGSWSLPLNSSTIKDTTLPDLPDNLNYTYSVTATDKAGNQSSPTNGTFGLDRTPPAAPQFGVKAESLHSKSGMTLFTTSFANSNLYGKAEAGDRVQLIITGAGLDKITGTIQTTGLPTGDKPLTIDATVNNDGTWHANLTTLKDFVVRNEGSGTQQNPDGAFYNLVVKVTDAAGNSTASDFKYEMGKNKPTSTIDIKQTDGKALDIERTTFEESPLFTGNTRPGATVVLNLSGVKENIHKDDTAGDGSKTITATADDDGNWRIPLADHNVKLAEGLYYYSVTVTDENSLTDTTGAKAMGGHGENINYFLRANFTPVGTEESIKFDPKDDSGVTGDHISKITTQHIVGEVSGFTKNIAIYASKTPIDEANPGKLIASAGDGVSSPKPGDHQATIINDDTGSAFDRLPYLNNKTWHVNFIDPDTGSTTLTDGTYYIRVVATNTIGRTDIQEQHITIDTIPPELNIVALATDSDTGVIGDQITSLKSPTLAGITKPNTEITVHLIDGESRETTQKVKADAEGRWQVTYFNMKDGTYKYYLDATDPAGNEARRDHTGTTDSKDFFTIQSTFAGPTSLNITSDLSTDAGIDTGLRDYITANTMPTITGTAPVVPNTGKDGASRVFLDIVVNGITHTYSGHNTSATPGSNGTYSIRITDPLPDGYYKYSVYTQDQAGNKSKIFDSPANLRVSKDDGSSEQYAFKVQTTTPYQDIGIAGTSDHHLTTTTGFPLSGKIIMQKNDKPSNYQVTVTATDFDSGRKPITQTKTATVGTDGTWTSSSFTFTAFGVHNYTVTINDLKTGTNTSYTKSFTITDSSSSVLTKNDTIAEQHGSQPTFSGTTPAATPSVKLYIYDKNGNLVSGNTDGISIAVDPTTHKFDYKYTGTLANGSYTYSITTVSEGGIQSSKSANGVLEVWTTPPKLLYTEQDISLPQGANVSFVSGEKHVLFAGTLDLKNDKFAAELPSNTITVKFQDFVMLPKVDATTGRWQITEKEYNDKLAATKLEKPELQESENTAYTVTIRDRFQNTSSDQGDLTANNEHTGKVYQPLFMGESEPLAGITVIIKGQTSKQTQTATTTADDKGHWDLTWLNPLPNDTYHYSVQVRPVDSSVSSYTTGEIGTFTITDYVPSATAAAPAAPATDSAEHTAAPAVADSGSTEHTDAITPMSRSLFDSSLFSSLITIPGSSADSHPASTASLAPAASSSDHAASGSSSVASSGVASSSASASDHSSIAPVSTALAASIISSTTDSSSTVPPTASAGTASSTTSDHSLPGSIGLAGGSAAGSATPAISSALSALLSHGTLLSPTEAAPDPGLRGAAAPRAFASDTSISLAALEHASTDHEHHHAA